MRIRLFTLPNLLTLMNLLCGALAVAAVFMHNDLTLAFWLIVAGVAFDFMDGFVARMLHVSAPIGVQLDSLADMITSGLAPTAILYRMCLGAPALWWHGSDCLWLLVFVFAAFAALRLAKFNVDDTQTDEFCGLPAPAAALLVSSLGMLWQQGAFAVPAEAVLALALASAGLMIAPLRMFSLKFHGFAWRGNRLRYLFLAVCAVLVVCLRTYSIPLVVVLYIAVSAVRRTVCPQRTAAK